MTLVFGNEELDTEPKTHALVIGVGNYVYLPENAFDSTNIKNTFGLTKLSSPPISAINFAHWLMGARHVDGVEKSWGLRNHSAPLGTVELLTTTPQFETRTGSLTIEQPIISNIESAFHRWFRRSNTNKNNVALFYFCGHGVQKSDKDHLLLASDFGNSPNPWQDSFNFTKTHQGMVECQASVQCFFIDACRDESSSIRNENIAGEKVFVTSNVFTPARRNDWTAPIYYGATGSKKAFGRRNEVSDFTKVLIKALNGQVARKLKGKWCVTTDRLFEIRQIARVLEYEQVPSPAGEWGSESVVHFVSGDPLVTACVECVPTEAINEAAIKLIGKNQSYEFGKISNHIWRHDVAAGDYDVEVGFGDLNFNSQVLFQERFEPPVHECLVDVGF